MCKLYFGSLLVLLRKKEKKTFEKEHFFNTQNSLSLSSSLPLSPVVWGMMNVKQSITYGDTVYTLYTEYLTLTTHYNNPCLETEVTDTAINNRKYLPTS